MRLPHFVRNDTNVRLARFVRNDTNVRLACFARHNKKDLLFNKRDSSINNKE